MCKHQTHVSKQQTKPIHQCLSILHLKSPPPPPIKLQFSQTLSHSSLPPPKVEIFKISIEKGTNMDYLNPLKKKIQNQQINPPLFFEPFAFPFHILFSIQIILKSPVRRADARNNSIKPSMIMQVIRVSFPKLTLQLHN